MNDLLDVKIKHPLLKGRLIIDFLGIVLMMNIATTIFHQGLMLYNIEFGMLLIIIYYAFKYKNNA